MLKSMQHAVAVTILGVTLCAGATAPAAYAQAAGAKAEEAKQITLTQTQIDNLLAAQKDVQEASGNATADKPDSAADAKVAAAVKKHGFASVDEYSAVSDTVGLVMAGIDPETKAYIGPAAAIQKQIKQVQADKAMNANDKKKAIADLNGAAKDLPTEKPTAANIDIVKANYDKLSLAMQ